VLYPDASGTNSIIAEYLASHGFVVASAPIHGSVDSDFEYFSVRGIESLVADFAFVHAALDTVPFIDARNAASMGLGFGATGALAFQIRSPAIRAVVSLEGGITTDSEQRLLFRWPMFDVGAVRVPLLAITAPHPAVDPARLQVYRYAPQFLAHFAAMGEFWFQDYGKLDALSPGIIGRPPGDVSTGFEWGARLVRAFLAAHLRNDTTAARWLRSPSGAPAGVFAMGFRAALPPPPTLTALKRMIDRAGVAALDDSLRMRAARDSQPLPAEYFVALNAWLSEGRDAVGDKRRALADIRVRLYPRSARAHASLAASALRLADSAVARRHYAESLRLIAEDTDPLLDLQTRSGIERAVRALGTGR
jgi:dienelactone hydrolase